MNYYNRVKFTTATAGTGTVTVGSASTGFRTPAQASVANAAIVRYVIEDGNDWETGYGTYTVAGTTLSRNVLQSSNADALLNLSGSAVIRIAALAEDFNGSSPPNRFVFDPMTVDANTNFGNLAAPDTGLGLARYSTGVINAEIQWAVNLPAGTYSIFLVHTAANNRGKYHFLFDASDVGNIDGYTAGATAVSTSSSLTGIALAGGSPVTLKIKMASKNASSSDYYGIPRALTLLRTGA